MSIPESNPQPGNTAEPPAASGGTEFAVQEIRAEDPGSMRELLRVAFPLVLSSGSLSLMSAADRIILAGYSADSLAAVTPASMLHWTVVCIPLGTILYANTFIAQFDGAGQPQRLLSALWQAIWLAIVGGLLLLLCIPFSRSVFQLALQSEGVIREQVSYFNTLCVGSILLLMSTALSCYFSGRRLTAVVMYVNMFGVVVNCTMDYLLVFGIGPFPELGIRGAALATLIARGGDILIFLMLILRRKHTLPIPFWSEWRPEREMLLQYFRYGVPSGLHYFVDNSGFTTFLLVVGSLGRDALAATNLAFSVNGLIFVPLLGFGTAIQTLVGHHLGAGLLPAATQTTWNAIRLGLLWTGFAALMLILIPDVALRPFFWMSVEKPDAAASLDALAPTVVTLLRFVAVYSVFDALAVVFSSALRGAGDTVVPMVFTMCSSWLVMVVPALVLVSYAQPGLTALWLCCSAHIALTGGFMCIRFLSGRWKRIQLVERLPDAPLN